MSKNRYQAMLDSDVRDIINIFGMDGLMQAVLRVSDCSTRIIVWGDPLNCFVAANWDDVNLDGLSSDWAGAAHAINAVGFERKAFNLGMEYAKDDVEVAE